MASLLIIYGFDVKFSEQRKRRNKTKQWCDFGCVQLPEQFFNEWPCRAQKPSLNFCDRRRSNVHFLSHVPPGLRDFPPH